VREVREKLEKVRNLMREKNLDSIIIARNDNFSWITAGARGWVVRSSELASAWILINEGEAFLVSNNIEARRLLKEEKLEDFKLLEYEWYEDPFERFKDVIGERFGSDFSLEGSVNVSAEMKELRMELTDREMERARSIGRDVERIFEEVLVDVSRPDMSEIELASEVQRAFTEEGFNLPVLLVFSEESRNLYRHNLPTARKLGRFFFVSICAEKHGLVLSATRSVSFGKPPESLEMQHRLNALVDAKILAITEPGKTLSEMFEDIRKVYEEFETGEEFRKHHQGGIAGYNPREEKALPGSKTVLKPNMLIAWNPTITGTKSEDTFLLSDRPEYLTFTEDSVWPVLKFQTSAGTVRRPGIKVL